MNNYRQYLDKMQQVNRFPFRKLFILGAIAFFLTTNSSLLAQTSDNQPPIGTLEVVAELSIRPWNHAVTDDGRIFATVVRSNREQPALVEITGRSSYKVFPNEAWNGTFDSSPDVLNTPHGILIDKQNRLWVIDRGSWTILPDNGRTPIPDQPTKLLAFDINTGDLVYRFDFDNDIAPISQAVLQDLAIDEDNGFVYLADSSSQIPPAIVAVDLEQNTAHRFDAHPALKPEDVNLVVEGEILTRTDATGQSIPARIGVNPISLSSDRETLFFGSITGTTLWSLPTQLLREGATDNEIAAAIQKVGNKPVSDGMTTDDRGNHYITNLPDNAISVLTNEGELTKLVQDDRLIWSDSLDFGEPGWLYVAVNQLNRSLFFESQSDRGQPPYLILRVRVGSSK